MMRWPVPVAMAAMSLAAMGLAAPSAGAWAQTAEGPPPGVQVVTALYGPAGAAHPYDFSDRLQRTCGDHAVACESFCSRALIGRSRPESHMPFGPRPICRVVYRCGESTTRATETDANDTLILSCRTR